MKLDVLSSDETWCMITYENRKMHMKQNIFLKQILGNSSRERWKEIKMDFETKIFLHNDPMRLNWNEAIRWFAAFVGFCAS